jgi:hypothetical protein
MSDYNQATTYLDDTDVFRGSVAIELSPYQATPSYTAIGALTEVTIQRNLQTTEEQVDNAPGDQRIFKDDHTVTFNRCEILNSTVTQLMLGDTDTFANTAAAPVAGDTYTIAANWTDTQFYPLPGQNSSGAVQTINSVTASVTGALSGNTATIDDYKMTYENGEWGIVIDTAGAAGVATTESIVVDYDYTPAASTKQTFSTGKTLTKFIMRMTGVNQGQRQVVWTFYKCQLESFDVQTLNADDAEDARLLQPHTVACKPDGTYNSFAVGDKVINAS